MSLTFTSFTARHDEFEGATDDELVAWGMRLLAGDDADTDGEVEPVDSMSVDEIFTEITARSRQPRSRLQARLDAIDVRAARPNRPLRAR